jgi:hypothetical protein
MNRKMKGKGNVIIGVAVAAIILATAFAAIVPNVSAGIGYDQTMPMEVYTGSIPQMNQWKDTFNSKFYAPLERTTTVGNSWLNRQWKDTFNSKFYAPLERTTTIGNSWLNRQWKDTFNSKFYAPLERTTSVGNSWLNRQWKDTFDGKSYAPLERTTNIMGFTWKDSFNGKFYAPSLPMPPSHSGISSGYKRW